MNEKVCKTCKWCTFVKRKNNYPTFFCTRFPQWLELLRSGDIDNSIFDHYCGEWEEAQP